MDLDKIYFINFASFVLITLFDVLYCCYKLILKNNSTIIIYKAGPLSVLILQSILYLILRKRSLYNILISVSFLFCLLGDVLLGLYEPDSSVMYFLCGGGSFLIARIIMVFAFVLHLKDGSVKYIDIKLKSYVVYPSVLTGIGLYIYLTNDIKNYLMVISLLIYIISMIIDNIFVTTRIGFNNCIVSPIIGTIGVLLFNVADGLLFVNMFALDISYLDLISINIYWISMFLIGLSFTTEKYEPEISYFPLL